MKVHLTVFLNSIHFTQDSLSGSYSLAAAGLTTKYDVECFHCHLPYWLGLYYCLLMAICFFPVQPLPLATSMMVSL